MSTTLKGAKEAAVLKWEWLCQAPLRSAKSLNWPVCGFCVYYEFPDWSHQCQTRGCVLGLCNRDSLYGAVERKAETLTLGYGTLAEFRTAANKMLDKIKSVKV